VGLVVVWQRGGGDGDAASGVALLHNNGVKGCGVAGGLVK
jgi:hypothetical protein